MEPILSDSEFGKRVNALKRKLDAAAKEIRSISEQGKLAASDPSNVNLFFGMYRALDKYFSKFEDLWEKTVDEFVAEGRDKEFPTHAEAALWSTVRQAYYNTNARYVALSKPEPERLIDPNSSGNTASTVGKLSKFSRTLPRIPIPRFDGAILKFPKFRDTFNSLVNEDESLSPVDKFHYLISALEGSAASVISGFAIDEGNYDLAWKAVLSAYDNKRMLASSYLNQILSFKPLEGKPTADSMKTFLSQISDAVAALKLIPIPNLADFILFHLTIKNLDPGTREQFEIAQKDTTFPTIQNLTQFVRERSLALELTDGIALSSNTSGTTIANNKIISNNRSLSKPKTALLTNNSNTKQKHQPAKQASNAGQYPPCPVCKTASHHLLGCEKYERASVDERQQFLKQWKGCRNCLSSSHSYPCPSTRHCRFCKVKHHSTLHKFLSADQNSSNRQNGSGTSFQNSGTSGTSCSATSLESDQVILGTILAEVLDARGLYQPVRMVLDSGSQFSFITTKCMQRLGIKMTKCPKKISGIGETLFEGTKGSASCVIRPRSCTSPNFHVNAMVVANITSFLPNVTIKTDTRLKYANYQLADPSFWKPGPIDFLLGADYFAEIFTGSTITFDENLPRLLGTVFGHVVVGRLGTSAHDNSSMLSVVSLFAAREPDECLNELLTKFWELEEPKPSPHMANPDDVRCEEHFLSTHSRLDDGSYVVRLPFKNEIPAVGDSTAVSLQRFQNLERKLHKTPDTLAQYRDFMSEYMKLGHMTLSDSKSPFIIPHHCVMKPSLTGSKLRVVFDASVKVKPSSLNEQLLSGEKLQHDIRSILLNFRRHKVVFVTDVVKMYRMITLHPDDRIYQHIYWRSSPTEAIQEWELNTVTYGLTSAPFLALRVVKQLCLDEGSKYPLAADAIARDIYVDDVVTGSETTSDACELATQIISLMKLGGFRLSKWASNSRELLTLVPENVSREPIQISNVDGGSVKILGLQWDPESDRFGYSIEMPKEIKYTKRAILSAVSKIYDPLGFLSPTVITMKTFIQTLWKEGYSWDQQISNQLRDLWDKMLTELPNLSKISIPRFVETHGTYAFQLVSFCDASSIAFCGAIYLRIISSIGIKSFLLTSKTKLASVNATTIPRMELCGAYLLVQLYEFITPFVDSLKGTQMPPVFFSDSSVVLGWLNTPPYRMKTYVANRVGEITAIVQPASWRHVGTADNPSDLGTRGLMPNELIDNTFWWCGPPWLQEIEDKWPKSAVMQPYELPELKNDCQALVSRPLDNPLISWMTRFSSFEKLIRCTAWLRRWMYNSKHVGCCCCPMRTGSLTLKEIHEARLMCIRTVQNHYILGNSLDHDKKLAPYSHLSPFFDRDGVIRVGGRLRNANISHNQKHPILLPTRSHFSTLLVDHSHRLYLHPGPTALQGLIQTSYWIPSLRKLIRTRGFHCIKCYKSRALVIPPLMGDLPSYRVNGGRPFLHVGIDFAGPFNLRESMRRKAATSKVYLSLFVCMATKALHLEAVTRLSTDAFIATFERFSSRRGLPSDIYSDQGSNFMGAASHYRELARWFKDQETRKALASYAVRVGFEWHFNPPHTPHMGGIWEAGVKSVKRRLHLIAGDTPLTYEELGTLFAKIEAQLNSRPLCPLSNSPEETDFLSPGHFLIGGPILAIPEPSLLDTRLNQLDRWQLIQRMAEEFWRRWRKDYLWTLQHRQKWTSDTPNLQPGDLVLLKEDNVPPLQWPLAKIEETCPGNDGRVRVVKLRTSKSSYTRPVHKLVPLLPLKSPPYNAEL